MLLRRRIDEPPGDDHGTVGLWTHHLPCVRALGSAIAATATTFMPPIIGLLSMISSPALIEWHEIAAV
jgi:hypothetical protein